MSAINSTTSELSLIPSSAIEQKFKNAHNILIATHIDPDGDAIGTQLAFGEYLKKCGKSVTMVRDSDVPEKYSFLHKVEDIIETRSLKSNDSFDTVVILECSTIERSGEAGRFIRPGINVINIDHHRDNAGFGTVNWVDIKTSSVGEMAFELFHTIGIEITPTMAECLYVAIMTDTGRFRYSSTSARTMAIAGELISAGADPHKICNEVYYSVQPSSMKLMGKVLNSIEYFNEGRFAVLVLTHEMLQQSGASPSDSEGLVDFTMITKGVIAGILLKEINHSQTKVSLRSNNGVNVSLIAAKFGGGGHLNASGCTVPLPIDEAKQVILNLFSEAIHGLA
jgi:bifunctional oligoribonuclease and PAP phosphatase NrnA